MAAATDGRWGDEASTCRAREPHIGRVSVLLPPAAAAPTTRGVDNGRALPLGSMPPPPALVPMPRNGAAIPSMVSLSRDDVAVVVARMPTDGASGLRSATKLGSENAFCTSTVMASSCTARWPA
jgi:hypothetical protein